jgi:hypothetical protein
VFALLDQKQAYGEYKTNAYAFRSFDIKKLQIQFESTVIPSDDRLASILLRRDPTSPTGALSSLYWYEQFVAFCRMHSDDSKSTSGYTYNHWANCPLFCVKVDSNVINRSLDTVSGPGTMTVNLQFSKGLPSVSNIYMLSITRNVVTCSGDARLFQCNYVPGQA